jgi:hypothetical protein
MEEGQSANKTIMAVLENGSIFKDFKRLLQEEGIDFTKPGIGLMVTLPAAEVVKPHGNPRP